MASEKTLTILRHAKTEAGSAAQDDFDRRLTPRGVAASHLMGEYMSRKGLNFDQVICSPAVRAQQTWEEAQKTYKAKAPVHYEKKLYLASGNEMLNLLAQLPEQLNSVLIIGHNPGLHQLALKLGKRGDDRLLDLLTLKFPTCALATITFNTPWKNLAQGGTLVDFTTPKLLSGSGDD